MTDTADISVWTIEFTNKGEDPTRKYRYGGTVTVVAFTAERAMAVLREQFPGAAVHALHKRSRGSLFVDPQIELVSAGGSTP